MKYYFIALGGACAAQRCLLHCSVKVSALTAEDVEYAEMQDVNTFLWPLSP